MPNKQIKVVTSLTELRAISNYKQNDIARVLDGTDGDDEYLYKTATTDADDDDLVIKPANLLAGQPGRWHRVG